MIVVAGAAARKVWAADRPAAKALPEAADEGEDEGEDESPASTREASGRPARQTVKQASADKAVLPLSPRPAVAHHFQQVGISFMPGTGYRLVIPYQENIICGDASGDANRRVCSHVLPFFLDLQLSYGFHPRVDLIVDLRFGLQQDPAPPNGHQFAFAPGFRYWLDQGVALKFYVTGQVVYDHTNYSLVSKDDIAVRNADGLMYDVIKNVGFFIQVGWTMGFKRWYRLEFDGGLGVQVRFP